MAINLETLPTRAYLIGIFWTGGGGGDGERREKALTMYDQSCSKLGFTSKEIVRFLFLFIVNMKWKTAISSNKTGESASQNTVTAYAFYS